jgi:hypothetical protein
MSTARFLNSSISPCEKTEATKTCAALRTRKLQREDASLFALEPDGKSGVLFRLGGQFVGVQKTVDGEENAPDQSYDGEAGEDGGVFVGGHKAQRVEEGGQSNHDNHCEGDDATTDVWREKDGSEAGHNDGGANQKREQRSPREFEGESGGGGTNGFEGSDEHGKGQGETINNDAKDGAIIVTKNVGAGIGRVHTGVSMGLVG